MRTSRFLAFDELIGRLVKKQEHGKWRFKDEKVKLKYGEPLNITMSRGGEAHTVPRSRPSASAACPTSTR